MPPRLPFRYLEPTFFAGLLDDPVLWVNVRPLGRAILVDCGMIHHLAKRVLRAVDAIFISHAHMDHFMGMDAFIRNVLVSPRTPEIYGPPGLAARMANKLGSYDWNLTEDYWCSFRVHEVGADRIRTFLLPGPEGFPCRLEKESGREDRVIYRNGYLTVEAEPCNHKIPVLAFRINENPSFQIDEARIEEEGLVRGPWLKTLKKRFYGGRLEEPLAVLRREGEEVREETLPQARSLYQRICKKEAAASIGYVTDIGFTEANRRVLAGLLKEVSLLICECTYLAEDVERARASYHLCTRDVESLARELSPSFVLPMHLSKSYSEITARLYAELDLSPPTTLLRIPPRVAPRPLLPPEVPDFLPVEEP